MSKNLLFENRFFRGYLSMGSLILAIIGLVFTLLGLLPLLGWLNWIGLIFLVVGLISGVTAYRKNPINKLLAFIGTLLCIIFLIISVTRLMIGHGII